jgi:hypothetical protein
VGARGSDLVGVCHHYIDHYGSSLSTETVSTPGRQLEGADPPEGGALYRSAIARDLGGSWWPRGSRIGPSWPSKVALHDSGTILAI